LLLKSRDMNLNPLTLIHRLIRSLLRRSSNSLSQKYNLFMAYRKFRKIADGKQIKLNLGSGPVKGDTGWTTIDVYGSDIIWDLRKNLPLSNNSVQEIYTSHLLEHLDYRDIRKLLLEIYRIMCPKGSLKICVPDASRYISAYVSGTLLRNEKDLYTPAVTNTGSFIDQVNYIAYMGGEHKFMFDVHNLSSILLECGFTTILERSPEIYLDSPERETDSLYLLAIK